MKRRKVDQEGKKIGRETNWRSRWEINRRGNKSRGRSEGVCRSGGSSLLSQKYNQDNIIERKMSVRSFYKSLTLKISLIYWQLI